MPTLPTAKVLNPSVPEGYMIVNLSDLTDSMVLADEVAETARRKAMKKQATATLAQTQATEAANAASQAAAEAQANAKLASDEAALAAIKAMGAGDATTAGAAGVPTT
jgi:predicted nucleotidyltransferase